MRSCKFPTAFVGIILLAGFILILPPPSALSDNRELLENFWHDQYGSLSKDTKNYVRPPSLQMLPEGGKKPDSFDPSIFSWKRLAKGLRLRPNGPAFSPGA